MLKHSIKTTLFILIIKFMSGHMLNAYTPVVQLGEHSCSVGAPYGARLHQEDGHSYIEATYFEHYVQSRLLQETIYSGAYFGMYKQLSRTVPFALQAHIPLVIHANKKSLSISVPMTEGLISYPLLRNKKFKLELSASVGIPQHNSLIATTSWNAIGAAHL